LLNLHKSDLWKITKNGIQYCEKSLIFVMKSPDQEHFLYNKFIDIIFDYDNPLSNDLCFDSHSKDSEKEMEKIVVFLK